MVVVVPVVVVVVGVVVVEVVVVVVGVVGFGVVVYPGHVVLAPQTVHTSFESLYLLHLFRPSEKKYPFGQWLTMVLPPLHIKNRVQSGCGRILNDVSGHVKS